MCLISFKFLFINILSAQHKISVYWVQNLRIYSQIVNNLDNDLDSLSNSEFIFHDKQFVQFKTTQVEFSKENI